MKVCKETRCVVYWKCRGFKDIEYNIPVCHEGHEGYEDIGTWHIIKHNIGAAQVPLDAIFFMMYDLKELYGESTGTVL